MTVRTDSTGTVTALPAKQRTTVRQRTVGRVVATVVFTVVEAWALVVVLADIRAGGMERIALALALAGCVIAVLDSWQNVRVRRTPDAPSDE